MDPVARSTTTIREVSGAIDAYEFNVAALSVYQLHLARVL